MILLPLGLHLLFTYLRVKLERAAEDLYLPSRPVAFLVDVIIKTDFAGWIVVVRTMRPNYEIEGLNICKAEKMDAIQE